MNIKESWKKHPLYVQGKVELVPIAWVWQYRGCDVGPITDRGDGTIVDLYALWEDIRNEGLRDPLIMRVGLKNKKFRLEAGNHRIQILRQHGVTTIPLTVQIREECGPHVDDAMTIGSHNFDADDEILIERSAEEYMKPSQVFRKLTI